MKQFLVRFRSGFLIYLTVVIISLGFGGVGASALGLAIRRQQDAAIYSHLQMEASRFEDSINSISSQMARGYQKLRSQKIVNISSPVSDTDRLAVYKAKTALEEIFNTFSYEDVTEVMLYLTRSNMAITSVTVYTLQNLAGLYFQVETEAFQTMINDFIDSGLSQTLHVLENDQKSFPLFLQRFNIIGRQDKIIGISVLSNNPLAFNPIYDGQMYIASAAGQCYDEKGIASGWPAYSELGAESFSHVSNENTYRMMSVNIMPGYRLAIAIPEMRYYRNSRLVNTLVILFAALAGFAMCLTLHHARRRHSSNLNEIGQLLSLPSDKRMLRPGGIEFEQIRQSLTHLIHQNNDLLAQKEAVQKQVESSRTLMRNSFIRMLILGKVSENELDNMLGFYGIDACYDCYRVLLLQFESRGMMLEETENARQALLTAASSMVDCVYETCIVDDYTVGMLYMCNLEQKSETDAKVRQYAAHIVDVMKQKLNLHISVGLGRSAKDIGNCLYAYHSSRMVLICSTRSGLRSLHLDDMLSEEDSGHLMHILHMLLQGETQQCLSAFDVMFHSTDEDNNYTTRQRTNAIVLFNLFDDTVNGNAQLKKLFADDETFNQQLSQCFTLDDILKLIRSMLERACLHIASGSERRTSLIIDHAAQVIQQRYMDASLSQMEIAEILGINAATLSTKFKEVIGVNMSAYIRSLRIERAKALLMDKNLSIDDVAEQTGFGSVKTMYRIFKTETGFTPGQYREEMC